MISSKGYHWQWAPKALLAAAAGAVALRVAQPYVWLPPCVFHTLTGWPCPSCGGTRAARALAGLEVGRALSYNPLVVLAALALVVASLVAAGERLAGRPLLPPQRLLRRKWPVRATIAGLVLANWAFLIGHLR